MFRPQRLPCKRQSPLRKFDCLCVLSLIDKLSDLGIERLNLIHTLRMRWPDTKVSKDQSNKNKRNEPDQCATHYSLQ